MIFLFRCVSCQRANTKFANVLAVNVDLAIFWPSRLTCPNVPAPICGRRNMRPKIVHRLPIRELIVPKLRLSRVDA